MFENIINNNPFFASGKDKQERIYNIYKDGFEREFRIEVRNSLSEYWMQTSIEEFKHLTFEYTTQNSFALKTKEVTISIKPENILYSYQKMDEKISSLDFDFKFILYQNIKGNPLRDFLNLYFNYTKISRNIPKIGFEAQNLNLNSHSCEIYFYDNTPILIHDITENKIEKISPSFSTKDIFLYRMTYRCLLYNMIKFKLIINDEKFEREQKIKTLEHDTSSSSE